MNYSITLNEEQINILINKYKEYQIPNTNYYTLFRAKIKLSVLSIYTTCKILIQGKDACILYKEICDMFNITIDKDISYDEFKSNEISNDDTIELYKTNIGNDEVGTGDFFGPIVVCSSCVSEDNYLRVKRLGVKDSKALNDEKIKAIAKELITFIPYSTTILSNEKYNEVIKNKDMNMNRIKAILHNNVMNKFLNQYPDFKDVTIVLDDFCGEEKYYEYLQKSKNVIRNIHFETKAENKYLSVACSSIIARYYFLNELDRISNEIDYVLLKGASNKVDTLASQIIKEKGTYLLTKIAKLNFKNYLKARKILDNINK